MIRFLSTPSARRATGLPVLRRWSYKAFLSTPSARRATHSPQTLRSKSSISIHALREEGDGGVTQLSRAIGISIHALREEGDKSQCCTLWQIGIFLSTPSARRATAVSGLVNVNILYFYPRPPRGGRQAFSSNAVISFSISIHALREEGDPFAWYRPMPPLLDFYPRPPRGGRRKLRPCHCRPPPISIHALREEGDQGNTAALSVTTIFLSTPSARRATNCQTHDKAVFRISIHALREEGDARAYE